MSNFLEDIEFASKVNEEIKRAEQRGIDNSLELTKEMIKQQYGDIEQLQQENKHLNLQLDQALKDYEELLIKIDKAIEYIKEHSYMVQDKEINGIPLMSQRLDTCDDLLEILGDKE